MGIVYKITPKQAKDIQPWGPNRIYIVLDVITYTLFPDSLDPF